MMGRYFLEEEPDDFYNKQQTAFTQQSKDFPMQGNSAKSIHDAEWRFDNLHYKNEWAISFENYISKAQACGTCSPSRRKINPSLVPKASGC